MKKNSSSFLFPFVSLFLWCDAPAADVEGSSDYPEIGRFEGSEIVVYRAENYGSTTIATGPVQEKSDAENTSMTVEGDITRIVYRAPKEFSALEVFRNFESRVQEAGYEVIVSGGPDVFDNYTIRYQHPVEKLYEISISGALWYLSAKKQVGEGTTYLSILVSPHSGGAGQDARLIAVTTKTMENRMLDAEQMRTSLFQSGKVALYGIYFTTDSAEIEAESGETLREIARLMQENPELNIIVVGHTDNQGSWEHNMDLSERRAASVAVSLNNDYGIDPGRLRSAGVGYLAPAATNNTVEGRQLNRRVELVNGN